MIKKKEITPTVDEYVCSPHCWHYDYRTAWQSMQM